MSVILRVYKCSKQVLAWSFKKSRDGWKGKALGLRKEIKVLKVRVADVSEARDSWRVRLEGAERQLQAAERRTRELEAELAGLRAEQTAAVPRITAPVAPKKSRRIPVRN